MIQHYDPTEMTEVNVYSSTGEDYAEELEYLREHYEVMVNFFNVTADSDTAATLILTF